MIFKFLIDECLSPALVDSAVRAGHVESTCVRNRGWSGTKDHRLIERIVAEDFTLVTRNASDFRGEGEDNPGGEHARQPIHAGLVCLNASDKLSTALQLAMFDYTLHVLAEQGTDLVNQALEVSLLPDRSVRWIRYTIPAI
ncbi:DUF5615 family PIN-like protein [Roseateles chitinivorans]|uniref:DUF5615 family PIN-like protein n=1 Tax=Roseateles chitinivorans TaxID=2917965 RepID=UPI003D672ACF